MASSVRQAFGENQSQAQQQNPRSAALNRMKEIGLDIPKGMENDPNALLNYALQSGKFPQNRLSMAQQIMRRMFGGR